MNLNLTKEQQLILLGLVASIIVGLGVMGYRHFFMGASQSVEIEEAKGSDFQAISPAIMVHVTGAVRREGVYKLKAGDRLLDVLEMAGGALPSANLSAVNLAEPIKDGQQIVVPVQLEFVEKASGTLTRKISLNTAKEEQLDSLPGIGKSTAQKIVEYRKTNGPFSRIEQIMEIPRFGKAKFERIKESITL